MHTAVFSSLVVDFAFAALFGILGGFVLGLLQDKGLEMPHFNKESGVTFIDAGFLADVLVGAAAGALTYALNPPAGQIQLFAATFTAGIGGSGILKAYIKGTAASEQANQAKMYKDAATEASAGTNVKARLTALNVRDQELQRRYGPR
jgi:hypothetical protein